MCNSKKHIEDGPYNSMQHVQYAIVQMNFTNSICVRSRCCQLTKTPFFIDKEKKTGRKRKEKHEENLIFCFTCHSYVMFSVPILLNNS